MFTFVIQFLAVIGGIQLFVWLLKFLRWVCFDPNEEMT